MAHGLPDRIWTLSRIKPLIGRRLHTRTTLSAIAQTLHRHGFSPQVPARRAPERNEEAVSGRVKETWPLVETPQRRSGLRLCCEDEAGFSMTPPTNRTRARPGHACHPDTRTFPAPVLDRCPGLLQTGGRSRPILRPERHVDHEQGGSRNPAWTDYRDLPIAARQQLGAPIVLLRDNVNVHENARLRQCRRFPVHRP